MACNRTGGGQSAVSPAKRPRAQRTLDFDILARFDAARVWSNTVSEENLVLEVWTVEQRGGLFGGSGLDLRGLGLAKV